MCLDVCCDNHFIYIKYLSDIICILNIESICGYFGSQSMLLSEFYAT